MDPGVVLAKKALYSLAISSPFACFMLMLQSSFYCFALYFIGHTLSTNSAARAMAAAGHEPARLHHLARLAPPNRRRAPMQPRWLVGPLRLHLR
jgi:hypothetical protein